MSIDCFKPMLHHIICLVNETRRTVNNKTKNNLLCSNLTVKHNNTCYMFKWFNGDTHPSQSFYDICQTQKMTPVSLIWKGLILS